MVLENIKKKCLKIKYGDRYDGLMKQTWVSVISRLHMMSALYISTLGYFHMYMDFEVFNFSEKSTRFAFYPVLWI
jgi:hypothetical protein